VDIQERVELPARVVIPVQVDVAGTLVLAVLVARQLQVTLELVELMDKVDTVGFQVLVVQVELLDTVERQELVVRLVRVDTVEQVV